MPIIGPVIDSRYLVKNVDRFKHRTVESITAKERSEVALEARAASEGEVDKKLADLNSQNTGIKTLGKYYNATGNTLKLDGQYNWYGDFVRQGGGDNQSQYNGQWAVFIHVNPTSTLTTVSSAGAFIIGNSEADVLLAFRTATLSRVYTEVRVKGHFTTERSEDYYSLLNVSTDIAKDVNLGYKADMNITNIPGTNDTCAIAFATVKLDH